MCEFSLEAYKSRKAEQNETLELRRFESGTKGFVAPHDPETAVCLMPGTKVMVAASDAIMKNPQVNHLQIAPGFVGIFAEKLFPMAPPGQRYHHDSLQFSENATDLILLQDFPEGMEIEVLELPESVAAPVAVEEGSEERELVWI